MRTDVKLGMIGSLAIVVVAGWYFTRQNDSQSAIPIEENERSLIPSGPVLAGIAHDEHGAGRSDGSVVELGIEALDDEERDGASASLADLFGVEYDEPLERVGEGENGRRKAASQLAGREQEDHAAPAGGDWTSERRSASKLGSSRVGVETHTVRPGDTIVGLARMYYGDVRFAKLLGDANPHVVDPAAIAVDTVIVIPESGDFDPEARSGPAAGASKPAFPGGRIYTVREGDTLYSISRRQLGAGSRWEELFKLNKAIIGDDPSLLQVGQVLTLPAK